MQRAAEDVDIHALDLGHLALFVGEAYNRAVLRALAEAGLGDLRTAHGYLIQHLLRGPHRLGDLAARLGVSQQAVSKLAAELVSAGYLARDADPDDARVVVLSLTARAMGAVELARLTRAELDASLRDQLGAERVQGARELLAGALEALGMGEEVRGRRVRGAG